LLSHATTARHGRWLSLAKPHRKPVIGSAQCGAIKTNRNKQQWTGRRLSVGHRASGLALCLQSASNETISSLCAVLELSRSELFSQDISRQEYQKAMQRMRLLPSAAIVFGAALGSGGMLLVTYLVGPG